MGLLVIGVALLAAIVFGVVWGLRERRPKSPYTSSGSLDDLSTFIIIDSVGDSLSDLLDD